MRAMRLAEVCPGYRPSPGAMLQTRDPELLHEWSRVPSEFRRTPSPAELAAQLITPAHIRGALVPLCKDPLLSVRDATDPGRYRASAEHVAALMREIGLQPLGDVVDGQRGFLQSFWWEPAFESHPKPTQTWNVIGLLPGKARREGRPNNALCVVGHLDNLSKPEKEDYERRDGRDLSHYEGACDNASAVVATLEIARAIQAAGGLMDDVIFFVPSGEEDGLKGSEAFVRAPPVPLNRIRGVVNFEMLGFDQHLLYGGWTADEAAKNLLYQRALRVSERTGARVVPGIPNDGGEGWWKRSDHYPFHREGIPSIMILGKPPPGYYHTTLDRLENLDPKRIRDAAQLTYRLLSDLDQSSSAAERRQHTTGFRNHYRGRVWPGVPPPS